MEGKRRLLVATPQRLLAINMSELKINDFGEESSKLKLLSLPVFEVVDLVKRGLPFGMRFFVRDSKLYMVGGEKPCDGARPEKLRMKCRVQLDTLFGYRGFSPNVYVSDLTTLDSMTEFREHSTMLAAKPNPIVEEIEGKIYVLSGSPWHLDRKLPKPTFEVYDPLIGQWKALSEPPFYEKYTGDYEDFLLVGHSVVGTTIYVEALNPLIGWGIKSYYSYLVNADEWKHLGESVDDVPVPFPLLPSFTGKFVPPYDDIFIFFRLKHLSAALIPSNESPTSPTLYQNLDEVYRDYEDYDLRHWVSCSPLVVELGPYEMCIMMAGELPRIKDEAITDPKQYDIPGRCTLYMATFRVEKLPSSSAQGRGPKLLKTDDSSDDSQTSYHDVQENAVSEPSPFLSVTCLSKGLYDLDEWGFDTPHICSAFFNRGR